MKSKFTLRVDVDVVRRAKAYAKGHGTSLSRLVETYLDALTRAPDGVGVDLTPRVQRLLGALGHADVDGQGERDDLIRKHS